MTAIGAPVGEPGEAGEDQGPAETWLATLDALLRGVAHALSNRVAAVSAVVGVLEPDQPDPELTAALGKEVGRLEGMLGTVRLLGGNPGVPASAVQVPQVLDAAIGLHEHHFDLRDIRCRVEGARDALPVHVPERAALRALLALLTGAKAQAAARGSDVVDVACVPGEGEVRVRLTPGTERATDGRRIVEVPGGEEAARRQAQAGVRAAEWLLRGADARVSSEEGAAGVVSELVLLTLPEARRRERERNG